MYATFVSCTKFQKLYSRQKKQKGLKRWQSWHSQPSCREQAAPQSESRGCLQWRRWRKRRRGLDGGSVLSASSGAHYSYCPNHLEIKRIKPGNSRSEGDVSCLSHTLIQPPLSGVHFNQTDLVVWHSLAQRWWTKGSNLGGTVQRRPWCRGSWAAYPARWCCPSWSLPANWYRGCPSVPPYQVPRNTPINQSAVS